MASMHVRLPSPIEASILGALMEHEMYGLELSKTVPGVRRSGVYAVLYRMEDKGLISTRLVATTGPGFGRRVCTITDYGRKAFASWQRVQEDFGVIEPAGMRSKDLGALRPRIAEILEKVAEDGLPEPRDLDVALDAIFCTIEEALPGPGEEEDGESTDLALALAELTAESAEKRLQLHTSREELLRLADAAINAGQEVLDAMRRTPGGDAYDYTGSTSMIDYARETVNHYTGYLLTGKQWPKS